MASHRNPDNIRKLLDKYKKNRAMTGKKDHLVTSRSDVLNKVSVDEEMMQDAIHLCDNEKSLRSSLHNILDSKSLSDLPEVRNIIEESAALINSSEKLKNDFDESSVGKIDSAAHQITQTANEVAQSLQSAPQSQFGAIINTVTELFKTAAAATAAGAACLKAYNNLDFHHWLTDTLVKRNELQEHLENMSHINTNIDFPFPLEDLEKKIWRSDLFGETGLKIGKIKNMPVEEYHEMIMTYFEKFGEATDNLSSKEDKFVNKHDFIKDDNIISYIAALEKQHIQRKLEKYEDLLNSRLIANFATQKGIDKTISILNTYTSKQDLKNDNLFSSTLVSAKNEIFNDNLSSKEIENAVRRDKEIQESLEKKAISKRNTLIARTLLLTAAALVASIAIIGIVAVAFAVPGLGPVLIGLGVIATACTIAAYLAKPEIFKDIKNDFSSGINKIMRYYNHEKKKDTMKQHKAKKDHTKLFHKSEKENTDYSREIPHPNHPKS